MAIVSASLDEKLVSEAEAAGKKLGLRNRSKMIASALSLFVDEHGPLDSLSGKATVSITVVYHHSANDAVSSLSHGFDDVIATRVHQSVGKNCVEVMVARGRVERLRALVAALGREKSVSKTSYCVV